jgi:hypothetical protein
MHSVKQFLKETLSLDIAPEKTQIQSSKKGIDFLGYTIKAQNGKRLIKMKVNGTHCRKRTTNGQILLSVPKEKIIGFVKDHKYGNLQEMESIHRGHYLNSSDVEIVEAYNSELRGFANYYNLARDVKSQLRPLMFLTHGSLTKTLASKHRISVAKVFARLKSGNELILQGQENGKNYKIKIFSLNHMKPSDKGYDEKPLTAHLYKQGTELTRRMTAEQCEYCGRTDRPMEVHHVKKLKDVKSKPNLKNWEKAMIARSRKTLILCAGSNESCHNLLHQGKLPDIRYTSDVDHT